LLANEQTRAWTDRAAIHPGRGIACEGGEALVALNSAAAVGGRLRWTVRPSAVNGAGACKMVAACAWLASAGCQKGLQLTMYVLAKSIRAPAPESLPLLIGEALKSIASDAI